MRFGRIELRAAPAKGRGLYAATGFEAGEVIDVSACVELSPRDAEIISDTTIDDYYFSHPADPEAGLLVLGLASFSNHDENANTETLTRRDPDLGWIVELRAVRPIVAGEEITRRYACAPWFPLGEAQASARGAEGGALPDQGCA